MSAARRLHHAAIALLAASLAAAPLHAQGNEENWHPLSNGFDGVYADRGAGGGQTTGADGIGTWVPGEDLRGSTLAAFSGDFSYKMVSWMHTVCLQDSSGDGTGYYDPRWTWWEFNGLNANNQPVFTEPFCIAEGLLGTGFGHPYGTPASSTASFLIMGLPTFLGTANFVVPNGGLVPSGSSGEMELIAALTPAAPVEVPTGCYVFGARFLPTAIASRDDIDGWWHWAQHGPLDGSARNYWGYSFDEINVWQSQTVESTGNVTEIITHPCVTDFAYHQATLEANTTAALAPNGAELGLGNTYSFQVENTNSGVCPIPTIHLNLGYDVGRGAMVLSRSGVTGYVDYNDRLSSPMFAPQDPAGGSGGGGGKIATLGFMTWDTREYLGGGVVGSERVTWIALDWDGFFRKDSSASSDITCFNGQVRRPFKLYANEQGSTPQDLTLSLLNLFCHTTLKAPSGFPDPEGGTDSIFADEHVAATSSHLPTDQDGDSICLGVKIALEYGSSGLSHNGGLTCDPDDASTSGIKTLFLLD